MGGLQRPDNFPVKLELNAGAEETDRSAGVSPRTATTSGNNSHPLGGFLRVQLLEVGAAIEVKDEDGGTPVWWAAARGYERVVRQLLEKGARRPRRQRALRLVKWK